VIESASGPQLLHGEVNRPVSDFELERHSHFAKLIIKILDPIFKALRGKVSHVANQQLAHKIIYNFPLTLGERMHCSHARILSRIDAPSSSAFQLFSFSAFQLFSFSAFASSSSDPDL
jgi:hypothetical protein